MGSMRLSMEKGTAKEWTKRLSHLDSVDFGSEVMASHELFCSKMRNIVDGTRLRKWILQGVFSPSAS